ncbi:hypothetical protein K474DRAFT_1682025 [Panus rudis PR-1116 ss-1]|nr:hypothetical protein K474DRAFT_1682025 [Panus rudis PR-1116 ss-1]
MKTESPLQRGKACLCCRKRKMKCDGVRPICTQCVKANREAECQYHDKKQVSRTQMLQQKLAKLEARLRELESEQSDCSSVSSPTPSSAAISVHDPMYQEDTTRSPSDEYAITPDWESALFDNMPYASSSSSPSQLLDAFLPSPPPSDMHGVGTFDYSMFLVSDSSLPGPSHLTLPLEFSPGSSSGNKWWEDHDTVCQNKRMLIEIFLEHRHQCAFDVHIQRFQNSLNLAPHERPHPALLDAIYLMGCYFSRSSSFTVLEPHFLKRALRGISDAMQDNDRVINVLQASCLLALYFFAKGRILEGYYHSSIAARLAVSLGLHQIKTHHWFQSQFASPSPGSSSEEMPLAKSSVQLAPPADAIQSEERVSAFWQVFMVDRAWSVATGLPAALPDDEHPQAQIETMWPTPLSQLTAHDGVIPRYDLVATYPTLRAKAVTIFEGSFRLASASAKGTSHWLEHRAMEMSLSQLSANLPPVRVDSESNSIPLIDIDLLTIHTLVQVSIIHLHRELADTNQESYQKCIVAANTVTAYLRQLSDNEFVYLDPINSTCWMTVGDVYLRALAATTLLAQGTFSYLNQELGLLVNCMRKLGLHFPIAGIHAAKLEQDKTSVASNAAFIS